MNATCSPMIEKFFHTMIVAIKCERVVIMIHPNISAGNCFEPP